MFHEQAAACHTTIRIILGTGVVHAAYVQHAKHFNKWQRVRIFDGWRAVGPPIYQARPAIHSEPPARQLSSVYTTAQRESDPFPIWIDIALHDIHIFRRLTNCCWLLQGVADREHQQPAAQQPSKMRLRRHQVRCLACSEQAACGATTRVPIYQIAASMSTDG